MFKSMFVFINLCKLLLLKSLFIYLFIFVLDVTFFRDLSTTNLNGPIPPSLTMLTNLNTLYGDKAIFSICAINVGMS